MNITEQNLSENFKNGDVVILGKYCTPELIINVTKKGVTTASLLNVILNNNTHFKHAKSNIKIKALNVMIDNCNETQSESELITDLAYYAKEVSALLSRMNSTKDVFESYCLDMVKTQIKIIELSKLPANMKFYRIKALKDSIDAIINTQ